MSWDHSQLPLFQLDHPLVDFMKADTPFSFVKAARKWNEPFLWDHVVLRTRSYTREAAQANSPWGLLWHAYTADYLRPVERVDLHRRAYDILPSMRGPNLDFIDDYRNGRFLHVIGSSACSADQKYYLKHRERATRATCTWLVIAKRLGLYRDRFHAPARH